MQFIRDIIAARQTAGRPVVSFEFFTPKTPEGDVSLIDKTLAALKVYNPDYCSVTYGAGGSTRDKTLNLVSAIQQKHGIPSMTHLTCVGATRAQIADFLAEASRLNIRNVLALRGDPPGGVGEFQAMPDGFNYAYQLVDLIRETKQFSIGVAGFPEGHLACKEGKHADWQRLKDKVERGADFVLSQLFFDNRFYLEYRDFLQNAGVRVPLFPGIIPIQSATQVKRFTALCGASIPAALLADLEKFGDDEKAAMEFGIEYASKQCAELLKEGVPGLHFYTLNKAYSTGQILKNIGLA